MINGFKSYKRIWSGPVIPCLFQSCCDEMDIVLSMHLVSYPLLPKCVTVCKAWH